MKKVSSILLVALVAVAMVFSLTACSNNQADGGATGPSGTYVPGTITFGDGTEKMTFEKFYEALIDDVGSEGNVYASMVDNQQDLSNGLDDGRQAVMGVNSDEELTNMIRYQQAYNAASRYINVITAMMDTVLQII